MTSLRRFRQARSCGRYSRDSLLSQRALSSRILFVAVLASSLLLGIHASAEIRVWVDDRGVTHFSDDPEAGPPQTQAVDENEVETLRTVWDDGLVGPTVSPGEASFGKDRVNRLLRGALADLKRGEVARADSTLRGVLRLDARRAEAHWYLAVLARARGRFTTAEHHLRRFLW